MRLSAQNAAFSVSAIAGTYVVVLSVNISTNATDDVATLKQTEPLNGLLGFSFYREDPNPQDHTKDEAYYMRGYKSFFHNAITVDPQAGGIPYSSFENPIQSFFWSDFSAKPNHTYICHVIPVYGTPKNLKPRTDLAVVLTVRTESEEIDLRHSLFFNRGVSGSQAFLKKQVQGAFTVEQKKLDWLSRGLEKALLNFIGRANGPSFTLRASIYEFQYPSVVRAFANAALAGATVELVVDFVHNQKDHPRNENLEAIQTLMGLVDDPDQPEIRLGTLRIIKRTKPHISHNKFVILIANTEPVAVWTGSTNMTRKGIFGHSNVGHQVNDATVANLYNQYWEHLQTNPDMAALEAFTAQLQPDVASLADLPDGITPFFSPRPVAKMLNAFIASMNQSDLVMITLPFGLDNFFKPLFVNVLKQNPKTLFYLLLDPNRKNTVEDLADSDQYENLQKAIGTKLDRVLGSWAKEFLDQDTGIRYIHTKYLLINPLSDSPIIVTGSANFSDDSMLHNDENVLIIKGNNAETRRVADIYFGEYLRLFDHFFWRNWIKEQQRDHQDPIVEQALYLAEDNGWIDDYFTPGHYRSLRRSAFSARV